MTAAIQHIVKAPFGLPPQKKTPLTWEQLCEFARAVLTLDARRAESGVTHIQAITRLDAHLRELKRAGEIVDFRLGEFNDGDLDVFMTVPDDRYFRQYLMPLREQVTNLLSDLNIYPVMEITTDLKCDNAQLAH